MADVTRTELNQQTARVLARVQAGEEVTVTDRGRPIARIAPVDAGVIDHALSLRSGLRAPDALHLSTALLYGDAIAGFATFDRELAQAARRFGLEVVVGSW